jgi:hypothetical protein
VSFARIIEKQEEPEWERGVMKKIIFVAIVSSFLCSAASGQVIISAGANGYLGETGIMPGVGGAVELGFEGCFTGQAWEATTIGFGAEWFCVTTTHTKTAGSGLVIPLIMKDRFALSRNFGINFGFGGAMVMMPVDVLNYSDEYEVNSSIGGALFAEFGLVNVFAVSYVAIIVNARAGGLFIEDGAYPFFGILAHIGYIIPFPREEE